MGFVLRHTISKKTATRDEIKPRPPIAMARPIRTGPRVTITENGAKKRIDFNFVMKMMDKISQKICTVIRNVRSIIRPYGKVI
jgi:hypothetical protein